MRNAISCTPNRVAARQANDFDRIFDHFFSAAAPRTTASSWVPAADVVEESERFVLTLDLPGVRREDVKVKVENQRLVVTGSRGASPEVESKDESKDRTVRRERFLGEFERSFRLGDRVDTGRIEARYHDGVLEVIVPKAEEARPHTIEVR